MRRAAHLLLPALCVSMMAWAAAPVPTPRLPDGRPDLNGTWDNGGGIDFVRPQQRADGSLCISGCDTPAPAAAAPGGPPAAPAARPAPDRPVYRPEHAARVEDLRRSQQKEDPVLRCQPPGVPRIGPPDKIMQTAREVVFLYEDVSGPFFRIVPLRQGVKRADDSESYLGDATGHWEGDTLVVVTRNFNELTWLTDDGAFHSADLVVTERLTRRGNEIEYAAVVEDPTVLLQPWRPRPRRMVLTDVEMAEPAPCVEQDLEHMVDDTFHANPR
ncbi:MAG TPA: hypothetical protein VNQ32_02530 [Steroidobacteraceae bacterium]|nr:hypothetical protein [Steroidobacteraceae bacterium]